MRQLNGIDADMIYGETAASHMHVLGLSDPRSLDRPRWLRRPGPGDAWSRASWSTCHPCASGVVRVPFGLDRPYWVERPRSRSRQPHPRTTPCPAPGGSTGAWRALVGELASSEARPGCIPLWKMWFIEGPRGWACRGTDEGASRLHRRHCGLDDAGEALHHGPRSVPLPLGVLESARRRTASLRGRAPDPQPGLPGQPRPCEPRGQAQRDRSLRREAAPPAQQPELGTTTTTPLPGAPQLR